MVINNINDIFYNRYNEIYEFTLTSTDSSSFRALPKDMIDSIIMVFKPGSEVIQGYVDNADGGYIGFNSNDTTAVDIDLTS